MAENLPVKCSLKKLGKTYNNLGKEIVKAIIVMTTLFLSALPGVIVVVLAVYGYISTVVVAMAPYLQIAQSPPQQALIQFVGFMATILLFFEIILFTYPSFPENHYILNLQFFYPLLSAFLY